MRILVTGGAGYLGSVLVPELLARAHQVTVLDNFMYGQNGLLGCCAAPGLEIIRADVREEMDVSSYDAFILLAAIVGAPACDLDRTAAVTTNFLSVERLARVAQGRPVIYPNTNSGYGHGENCTEDTPLKPLSLYASTKAQAEAAVLTARGVSLRFATLFGTSPRMRLDLMVNDFTYRAVHDRALTLFEPNFRRNFLHVRDAARVVVYALQNYGKMGGRVSNGGQVFNAGLSSANMTKLELCEAIRHRIPDFTWSVVENRSDGDQRDYLVSNVKLEATGWRAVYSLDDGIMELIRAYQMPFHMCGNV